MPRRTTGQQCFALVDRASPWWCVKVINEVIKGLQQVAAYLDDVIVFDSDPKAHVKTHVRSRAPE